MLAAGGSLSGRTQLSKGASMVLNGDVVSTGDIVNAGEIYFDNQTTPDAVLSRAVAKGNAPVTFHKLTTSNLTGQGGTINMRVRLDGSNTSDQLVINGGQATGKTWLAFTNVGNSNLGVATTGQGIRVVDAQNGATTEEGAFALSRPLQAGAFNYTLNRDSDEDWYLRSENAYRAEVPLYTSMLTQAMDYDRILAGSRSHQTGVNGENNSVRLSIQGGHLGHDNNGGIARGATPESSGSYGFVRLEGDGSSSYQMLPGYFRAICTNGLVCGQSLGELRVPHRGNVVDRVIERAYEVVGVFDRIEEKRDAMQSLVLPPPARQALAQAALTYRYGDEHQPVTTADILTPRRREDYGKDLWSAYQTIQENMLKGGISGRSAKGKRIHIAACLMTYSHHACRTECYAMTVHYYRLRDYALQHPECSAIMRIID